MREAADAEGQRAQLDDQIVQFAARQVGFDHVPARPILLGVIAEELTATPRHEPLDAGRKRVRDRDLDRVDRLQQGRLAFRQGFLDRLPAGRLEGHVRAVDSVELTGDQNDRQVDNRKAERAVLQCLDDAFLDSRDVVARDGPADDAVLEHKAGTARQRLHLDRAIGKLPVPAALALEARMLVGAALDRLAVWHRRGLPDHDQVLAVAQPVERDLQMHIALAPQHHLAQFGVLLELERRVFVDQSADRAGQLDIVATLLGMDRKAVDRLRALGLRQGLGLPRRGQHGAGTDLLHAGQPDDLARLGGRRFVVLRAEQAHDTGDPRAVQHIAFGDRAAPDARQRQFARVRQVERLEHLRHRLAVRLDAEAGGRLLRARRLMAQCLPKTAGAVILGRGAEKHRHDQVLLKILGQVLVNFFLRGLHILEQLLEQLVVEIGELLDELGAGFGLAVPEVIRQRDQVGGLARAVMVGTLADEIDIAVDRLGGAQRHLAQDQGLIGMGLQCREHVAHPGARGVELVDENHVRDLVAAEKAQERAHRHRPLDLGLAHDDDGVGHQHRLLRLIEQLDIARAVEDRPGIVEEGRVGDVDLGRHLPRPSLGGVVTDRIAFAHAAMPPDRAARKQHRFEQARLARQIRADKSNAAGGTRHRFLHKIRSGPPGPGGPLAGPDRGAAFGRWQSESGKRAAPLPKLVRSHCARSGTTTRLSSRQRPGSIFQCLGRGLVGPGLRRDDGP